MKEAVPVMSTGVESPPGHGIAAFMDRESAGHRVAGDGARL
ncbi:MAG: hypothetical protein P8Y66_12345 [Nitrospirota bacterium]